LIIAASIRSPIHLTQAALAGADIATVPYNVLMQSLKHPLTDKGVQQFIDDHKKMLAAKKA
jgi:transaldolase